MTRSRAPSSAIVPLVILVVCVTFAVVNAGINFRLPIPLISFYNPLAPNKSPPGPGPGPGHHLPRPPSHSHSLLKLLTSRKPVPQAYQQHPQPHHQKTQIPLESDPHHHYVTDHTHKDQGGRLYLHDPDSIVQFYYKENLLGPSNRVDIHHDGCREVPMDYWYQRPKSLWAKHCITLYSSGHCKGEGVQVAGGVSELRSAGMHYGVNSFKPCEKNIRIRFMSSPATKQQKHKHHHHHRQQTSLS